MKKVITLTLTLFLMISFSHPALAKGFKVGCSLNYHSPQDSLYKGIYGKGNFMFSGSLSYEIKILMMLEFRAEANYFQDKGELTATKEEITFTFTPIVLGIRFKVIGTKINPYFGIGVDFCSYKEKLPDRFEDVSESTTGFHMEAGSYLNLTRRLHLDLNIRYLSVNAESFDKTVSLGGFRTGIGIGYNF